VLTGYRDAARARRLEPKRFIHARVLGGITTGVGDPHRALCVGQADELVCVDVADLEAYEPGNVLALWKC